MAIQNEQAVILTQSYIIYLTKDLRPFARKDPESIKGSGTFKALSRSPPRGASIGRQALWDCVTENWSRIARRLILASRVYDFLGNAVTTHCN